MKVMYKDYRGFSYLKEEFTKLNDPKIKAEIIFGIQIREVLKDYNCENKLKWRMTSIL